MPANPWKITREMFLAVDEATDLLTRLRDAESTADNRAREAAATNRLVIETLIQSGLRNSELCRLRLQDTPVGSGMPCLEVVGAPRQDRTVFVPDSLSDLISRYVETVRPTLLPADIDPADQTQPLVFNDRGKPYERTALYRRVVRVLTACGLGERASVQLLRHTYGYISYVKTGGNLLFVQRQMGHAHPMVTAIYAQFADEDYAELANQIDMADAITATSDVPDQTTSKRSRTE